MAKSPKRANKRKSKSARKPKPKKETPVMLTQDLANRTGRVINAPNKLKLHSRPDLKSEVLAFLPNSTTFTIKRATGDFYEVYAQSIHMSGYVWSGVGKGADANLHYVELVPVPPPYRPEPEPYVEPRPAPEPYIAVRPDPVDKPVNKGMVAAALAAIFAVVAGLYSCSGGGFGH